VQVRGQVQGVGFRPFVYRLAGELGLSGWVRNCGAGVELEVQGSAEKVESMLHRLHLESPPLARIAEVTVESADPEPGHGFAILESSSGAVATRIAPDTAICRDCLAELFSPDDRRYRYPFINCTHCGPRYTIARGCPTTARTLPWRNSPSARNAWPSTAPLRIAVFTPKPTPARHADRN